MALLDRVLYRLRIAAVCRRIELREDVRIAASVRVWGGK